MEETIETSLGKLKLEEKIDSYSLGENFYFSAVVNFFSGKPEKPFTNFTKEFLDLIELDYKKFKVENFQITSNFLEIDGKLSVLGYYDQPSLLVFAKNNLHCIKKEDFLITFPLVEGFTVNTSHNSRT